jgi:hypothetical protein
VHPCTLPLVSLTWQGAHGICRIAQEAMERVEGDRRWGASQDVVGPADELKAACNAAGSWLRVRPTYQCAFGGVRWSERGLRLTSNMQSVVMRFGPASMRSQLDGVHPHA